MHLSQNITSTSYFDMWGAVSKEAQSPETSEKISKNPKTCDMQEAVSKKAQSPKKSKEFKKNQITLKKFHKNPKSKCIFHKTSHPLSILIYKI